MKNSRKVPTLVGLVLLLVGTPGSVRAVEDICRTCHGNSVADIHHVWAMTCMACHSPGVVIRDCTTGGCHDLSNLSDVCLSAEEDFIAVEIDDAYTMNAEKAYQTAFDVQDVVMYHIDYTIFGDPGKRYKVILSIKSMGDTLREVVRSEPGSYSIEKTNPADGDDGGTHTVKYQMKLKKGRRLLDVDIDTSQITVNP